MRCTFCQAGKPGVRSPEDLSVNAAVGSDSDQEFFALLELARRGDRHALGTLIERCRPYLLKIANDEGDSQLQGKVGGSDLVQYACLDAVRGFEAFRGRTSPEMLRWLRKILMRRLRDVRDHYQAHKRPLELPLPAETDDDDNEALTAAAECPSAEAVRREECELFDQALGVLSPCERGIIEMRQKEGLAFAEIARHLHMTEEAARKRWVRAIQSLQEEVERRHGLSSS
jgi:RNA polymerase sigma-70 factor (ECF subfamily)